MKHHLLTAGALALGLALASAAAAAQPAGGNAVMQACSADFAKLCPDAKPGPGGGLRECVVGHFNDLSGPCKQAIMTMRSQRQQQGGGASNSTAPTH
ncbi:MAG TPA: hypothetical protein VHW60_03745 [Caulobacteraceae bacterium]|jgi:hypothetical protein|nr:hypothetical protein [Caulobacteraceae bacterium]